MIPIHNATVGNQPGRLSNGVIVVWSQGVGFRILIRPGLGTATIQAVAESDDIVAPTE